MAIKILEKEKIKDAADLERINREITILKRVRHPNVVQLYDVSLLGACLLGGLKLNFFSAWEEDVLVLLDDSW